MADRHSEVEAKFRADTISVTEMLKFITDQAADGSLNFKKYKQIGGDDTYYQRDEDFIRHRYDGVRMLSTFTVKKRKSADSISDRQEVDLPLRDDVQVSDATAFLKLTGWRPIFTIQKMSYIAHLEDLTTFPSPAIVVCLALYDVWLLGTDKKDRYLELEIEKDSNCSHEEAIEYLAQWVFKLKLKLGLGEPMNQSLLEIYNPASKMGLFDNATLTKVAAIDDIVTSILKDRKNTVDDSYGTALDAAAPMVHSK